MFPLMGIGPNRNMRAFELFKVIVALILTDIPKFKKPGLFNIWCNKGRGVTKVSILVI